MPKNFRNGSADTPTDKESSKLSYDNFPHYEGIRKEVKELLIDVTRKRDFVKLLTLLIPSTTNVLLLLYASSEDFLCLDWFYSEINETVSAEAKTAVDASWSLSSEILLASGKHDEFASMVKELWSSSTFAKSLVTIIGSCSLSLPPTAPIGPLSPGGTEGAAENWDGSAGVIGEHRDKMLLKSSVEGKAILFGGPQGSQTASYADVAAGRHVTALPTKTTGTELTSSSPKKGLVLADFISPKYKTKWRPRKRSMKQNDNTVRTPAPADHQLSTPPSTQPAGKAASVGISSKKARGGDSAAKPEQASRSGLPSSPPMEHASHSALGSQYEGQHSRGESASRSATVFAGQVLQLEVAGQLFAERLAVGELQPDPAAIFYELLQQQRHLDAEGTDQSRSKIWRYHRT